MNGQSPLLLIVALLLVGCAPVPVSQIEVGENRRSRDEQVMDAVLKHFLKDDGQDLKFVSSDGDQVVLHIRNPEKNGILDQTEGDIRDRKLDAELLAGLKERNTGVNYDSSLFSFKDFRLDPRVVIADVEGMTAKFHHVHRRAKAHFTAFAPGYSRDGSRAVVRAWIGPSPHGATITYRLDLRDGVWQVAWRELAIYV